MSYNIGKQNPNWKGGKTHDDRGRKLTLKHKHPRANHNGYVFTHILIAERAIGRHLYKTECVHHVDKDPSNNHPSNLVVCQDNKYHKFLHKRLNAFISCGHADWLKCRECKKYDIQSNLSKFDKKSFIHKECNNKRMTKFREKNPDYFKNLYYKKGGD